ncbi:MAG: hypothetical protein ACLFQU_06655 [Candidatus Kapaibacterium sp.]
MKISEQVQQLIEVLDHASGDTLRKSKDLAAIIQAGMDSNDPEIINRIIFSGKTIWNLSKNLKRINSGAEGFELLEKELIRAFGEMDKYLAALSNSFNEDLKQRFNDVYLAKTRGAKLNTIDLSHDLAILKELQSRNRNH